MWLGWLKLWEFFKGWEWILKVIKLLLRLCHDVMCHRVHWEATHRNELLRNFIEDKVLLTAEQALEERKRHLLFLQLGLGILFPCHRTLSFYCFICPMRVLTLCASIRWFCLWTEWISFELFDRLISLYSLQIDHLIITWRGVSFLRKLHCFHVYASSGYIGLGLVHFFLVYLLETYQFVFLCRILISRVRVLIFGVWAFIFCKVLKHRQFVRSLQVLQVRCGWYLACLSIGQSLSIQNKLLLFRGKFNNP